MNPENLHFNFCVGVWQGRRPERSSMDHPWTMVGAKKAFWTQTLKNGRNWIYDNIESSMWYGLYHSLLTIWFEVIEDFDKDAMTSTTKIRYNLESGSKSFYI